MPEFSSYPAGSPCWVDLMSPDIEASKAFYSSVFGWEATDQHDEDGNRIYVDFSLNGHSVAGLGPTQPGMPPMAIWNTYFAVDDVDAAVAQVTEAGGSVMMPTMQVMEAGSMAIVADPTGAAFSLWQAGEHHGAHVANDANTWSWNELLTRDLDTARSFYTTVFGWDYDISEMPTGPYYVIAGGDHGGFGGLMAMPDELPEQVPNHWMVYFMSDDLDATLGKITSAGGTITQEPIEVPEIGQFAIVHDPNSGSFGVLEPAGE